MLMKNWIQNEINELQKILNDIKHFEEKAPSGTLRIHNKNGKTYYYRIRAYRLLDGKKVYGSYARNRKVKAK